jgi:hypothetical protein
MTLFCENWRRRCHCGFLLFHFLTLFTTTLLISLKISLILFVEVCESKEIKKNGSLGTRGNVEKNGSFGIRGNLKKKWKVGNQRKSEKN